MKKKKTQRKKANRPPALAGMVGSAPFYSGELSRGFWQRVNSIADREERSALYSLGCVLQNIEGYVLGQLQRAERVEVKHYTGDSGTITLSLPNTTLSRDRRRAAP